MVESIKNAMQLILVFVSIALLLVAIIWHKDIAKVTGDAFGRYSYCWVKDNKSNEIVGSARIKKDRTGGEAIYKTLDGTWITYHLDTNSTFETMQRLPKYYRLVKAEKESEAKKVYTDEHHKKLVIEDK